jgi:hypothetical protein
MYRASRIYSPRKIRKQRRCMYYCSVIILLSFFSMQITGCGSVKISTYCPNAFNSYGNQAEKNDLHIAIQPMTNKEEQETYFGVVLTDAGILPVYIIAENRNASHRFMLRDDRILLRNKMTNAEYPKPLLTDAADDSNLEGAKRTALIAGNLLLSAPLLFTSLGLARHSEKVKTIQDNMFDKTLFTQTILPGKTAGGFAYFKITDGKIVPSGGNDGMNNLALAIQVIDESTQSACDFQFALP